MHASEPGTVDNQAMFALSYGLFVLSAREGERDNACIINTAAQVTDTPKRISITVNKQNLTHDMILKTGVFNLSVLSQDASFAQFQQYGFRSGRDTADKFDGAEPVRTANGLRYEPAGHERRPVRQGHPDARLQHAHALPRRGHGGPRAVGRPVRDVCLLF